MQHDPTTTLGGTTAPGLLDRILEQLRNGTEPDPQALSAEFPESRAGIEQLIAVVRLVHHAADESPQGVSLDAAVQGDGPRPVLGDFRLLRELGRGGMGVVYEAEQLSLKRRIALKVLMPGVRVSEQSLERFEREARTAGGLQHANIVPVYAVGVAEGVHYYAMQLVAGQSLAELILGGRGSVRRDYDRVANWGAQIARGLAYAHERGVIHRDIKPSNILIDAAGQAWITDFGLARDAGDVSLTLTGDIVGTIRFMSPEQARGGSKLDERTDIYSLGVTLYEAIAQRPAFGGVDRESTLKRVLLDEPTPLRQIDGNVPRGLALIVSKAIAKNPDERYPSAAVFAEDLQRFLDREPLIAQPLGPLEQMRRIGQRYRTAVWFVGVLFAVVAGFGIWMSVLYADSVRLRADTQAALLAERNARALAESEAAKAQEVQAFLEGLLSVVSPEEARGADTELLRSFLDRAAERAQSAFSERPTIAAALRQVIGTSYRGVGEYERALPHLKRAVALFREHAGDADQATLGAERDLALTMSELGQVDAALEIMRSAVARSASLPETDRTRMSLLPVLGSLLQDRGELEEAERHYRETIAISEAHRLRSDAAIAAYNNLATLQFARQEFDEGAATLDHLLHVVRERRGPDHPETLVVLDNLAMVRRMLGDNQRAAELFAESLSHRLRVMPKHKQTLRAINNYAGFLRAQGRYDDAEARYRELLELQRETLGPQHSDRVITMYNLLGLLKDSDRLEGPETEFLIEEMVAGHEAAYGATHVETMIAHHFAAECFLRRGEPERARGFAEHAYGLAKREVAPDDPRRPWVAGRYVNCLLDLGAFDQAARVLAVADEWQARLSEPDAAVGELLTNLRALLAKRGGGGSE